MNSPMFNLRVCQPGQVHRLGFKKQSFTMFAYEMVAMVTSPATMKD